MTGFRFQEKTYGHEGVIIGPSHWLSWRLSKYETKGLLFVMKGDDHQFTLITGAANGIGEGFANRFAKEGHNLILVDIDENELSSVQGDIDSRYEVDSEIIVKNLASPTAASELYDTIETLDLQVDNLVNNAGIGLYGPFHEMDYTEIQNLLHLNVVTVTQLTRLYLDEMVERNSGRILNISSSAAFNPGPMMAIYNASKSYILLFTEAIAEELKDRGITVSVMCPDATRTNFFDRMGVKEPKQVKEDRMSPEKVAKIGYEGLFDGNTVIFTSRKTEIKSHITELLPRNIVRKISMRNEKSRDRELIETPGESR